MLLQKVIYFLVAYKLRPMPEAFVSLGQNQVLKTQGER